MRRNLSSAIDATNTPVISKASLVRFAMKDYVEVELKRLCSLVDFKPCTNAYIDWASPHVVSWRKNGKIWLCCGFRELNKTIENEPYPLSNIESTINSITNAEVYLKIDFSNASHQLPVDSNTQRLLGSISPNIVNLTTF